MGSQSKLAKTGVVLSLFLVPVNSLAAAFWDNWRRDRQDRETPTKLQ